MTTITLLGEPKSTGSIYRAVSRGRFAGVYMSKQGKSMKESYIAQAISQWHSVPLQGDIEIDVKIWFGTKRRSDIDNFHKLSFDALTGIVWEDDSQIQKMTVTKNYDKSDPRIVITVL